MRLSKRVLMTVYSLFSLSFSPFLSLMTNACKLNSCRNTMCTKPGGGSENGCFVGLLLGPLRGVRPGGPRCQCDCQCCTHEQAADHGKRASVSHLDSTMLSSFCLFSSFFFLPPLTVVFCLIENNCVLLESGKVSLSSFDHHWSAVCSAVSQIQHQK